MVHERTKSMIALMVREIGYGGHQVLLRAALNVGLSKLVFPVYRNIIALFLLVPLAYFLERGQRPALTTSLLMQLALLGLVGVTLNQGFYIFGLDNTSPTLASATENAVPAITFLMAALLRIEQVHLNRKDGRAKVLGVLASISGASVLTIYKGPTIYSPNSSLNSSHLMRRLEVEDVKGKNWTLGCFCLFGHSLCWSIWIVLQAPLLKKYPARFTITSYTCMFGVLHFLLFASIFERNSQAWKISSAVELFSVFYSGLVASGLSFAIQTWVVNREGPLFFSVYLPVQTIVVAVMASVTLGEEFYLGGIIGALLIIAGLYLVVWGKSEEQKLALAFESGQGASQVKAPFTQPFLATSSTVV